MSNQNNNKVLINNFIQEIWNEQRVDKLDVYLHEEYRDYSFLPSVPPTKDGLRLWISITSVAFKHTTVIDSLIAEESEVAIKICFSVRHIGRWRGIEPTGKEVVVKGFRFFTVKDGRIIEHHALLDGEALQTALTEVYRGCELHV